MEVHISINQQICEREIKIKIKVLPDSALERHI